MHLLLFTTFPIKCFGLLTQYFWQVYATACEQCPTADSKCDQEAEQSLKLALMQLAGPEQDVEWEAEEQGPKGSLCCAPSCDNMHKAA